MKILRTIPRREAKALPEAFLDQARAKQMLARSKVRAICWKQERK